MGCQGYEVSGKGPTGEEECRLFGTVAQEKCGIELMTEGEGECRFLLPSWPPVLQSHCPLRSILLPLGLEKPAFGVCLLHVHFAQHFPSQDALLSVYLLPTSKM